MHTNSIQQPGSDALLRTTFRFNAAFGALSGVIFTLASGWLSRLTGIEPSYVFQVTGVLLIGFAIWLAWLSLQEKITNGIAWFVVTSDVLWVLGSLAILIAGWPPLSVPGKWMVAGLAEVVGTFAILQTIGIRKKSVL